MSDPQNNQDKLEEVLKKIVLGQITKLHKSAERTGENFNVFDILNNEKTHSAIIAELLNPQGAHNQGTSFLKLFLDQLQEKLQEEHKQLQERPEQIEDNEYDKFKVGVEVSFEKKDEEGKMKRSRIDILIESDGIKNGDVCIVIENKIYAEDQKRQLGRYYEYALDTRKRCGIIYLTLWGDKPGEFTLYGGEGEPSKFYGSEPKIPLCRMLPKDTVVCLSYKEIDKWLDACIKKVAHIPQARETLHQYQMTVKKLTGQLPPEIEDILNGLDEKDDILKGVQHKLQRKFWRELKKRLALADKKPRFQLYNSDEPDEEIPDDAELEEKHILHNSLGLTFSIQNSLVDDEHEVAFRIYYERPSQANQKHSYFNYGFVFCKRGTLQRDKFEKDGMDIGQYEIKDWPKGKGDDGWISWKYFQYKPRNFITESKETLIRRLISEINSLLLQSRRD